MTESLIANSYSRQQISRQMAAFAVSVV